MFEKTEQTRTLLALKRASSELYLSEYILFFAFGRKTQCQLDAKNVDFKRQQNFFKVNKFF